MNDLVSIATVARLLGVTQRHVRRLVDQGHLDGFALTAKRRFITTESLRAYLRAQNQPTTSKRRVRVAVTEE